MLNEKTLVTSAITASMSILASALISWYLVNIHIEANMADLPKFAVGGYESLAQSIPRGASENQMRAAVEDMNKKIAVLESEGYLVLDERMVLSAPKYYFIPHAKIEASTLPDLREQSKPELNIESEKPQPTLSKSGDLSRFNSIFED